MHTSFHGKKSFGTPSLGDQLRSMLLTFLRASSTNVSIRNPTCGSQGNTMVCNETSLRLGFQFVIAAEIFGKMSWSSMLSLMNNGRISDHDSYSLTAGAGYNGDQSLLHVMTVRQIQQNTPELHLLDGRSNLWEPDIP